MSEILKCPDILEKKIIQNLPYILTETPNNLILYTLKLMNYDISNLG